MLLKNAPTCTPVRGGGGGAFNKLMHPQIITLNSASYVPLVARVLDNN